MESDARIESLTKELVIASRRVTDKHEQEGMDIAEICVAVLIFAEFTTQRFMKLVRDIALQDGDKAKEILTLLSRLMEESKKAQESEV